MGENSIPRCKPLKYTYEKEIVMYAYFKKLYYFSTECIYSPEAYRGHVRSFLKNLEKVRPYAIIDIIHSGSGIVYSIFSLRWKNFNELYFFIGENMCVRDDVSLPTRGTCDKCGYVSSQSICKACMLLEGLNRGLPKLGIGKSSHAKRIVKDLNSIKNDF